MAVICLSGCADVAKTPIAPNSSMYEYDVFLNGSQLNGSFARTSTFYLSTNSSVKAVNIIDNESLIDIMPLEDLTKTDADILSNIVVIADYAKNTNSSIDLFENYSTQQNVSSLNYTISEKVLKGQKHIYLNFTEPIRGYVAYTMTSSTGQEFLNIAQTPSIVRVVIPEGYTTGNLLIGRARPNPDQIYYDNYGRMNLVWYNIDTEKSSLVNIFETTFNTEIQAPSNILTLIGVKFYKESAPRDLLIAGVILGSLALIVIVDSLKKRRKLRKLREQIEARANGKKPRI
ncbi:DUF5803 family protein [uncultured Methanomethylovorans sp.]|uniref:DUF5803 family protein n=1 Tax=uncultured Methanomethylovorans sp. TaxID=183759 RepID=UPI0037485DDF